MRKMILALLLYTGLLGVEACTCEEVIPFWNITDFTAYLPGHHSRTSMQGDVATDTLHIKIDFEKEFLARQRTGSFTASALAMDCPDEGYKGLKDMLTGLTVNSSAAFHKFAAGQSLNDIARVGYTYTTVKEWLEDPVLYLQFPLEIYIVEKPEVATERSFSVCMDFASGISITATTESVVWR